MNEQDFSYIVSENEENDEESEPDVEMHINLDQNAGKIPDKDTLQELTEQYTVNNIHGFQNDKRELRIMMEGYRLELLQMFHYDRVYFNTGATESFQKLQQYISDLYINDGNHDYILSQQQNIKKNKFACLINLVNSSSSYDQSYQIDRMKKQGYKYIICDATQAIGRINLPDQLKCDCLFFSTHKYTGLYSCGFIFMSDQFYDEVVKNNIYRHKFQYEDIDNTFLEFSARTFDYPNFIINFRLTKQEFNNRPDVDELINTYKVLKQMLSNTQYIQDVTPKLQPGERNLYSSLLFKTKGDICVRSFQNYLGETGIQIGFSTACSSGKDGILRLSWRNGLTQNELDYVIMKFKETIKDVHQLTQKKLRGGSKQKIDNLAIFNKNSFWLKGHWVKSQDEPIPKVSNKYKDCFQDFILNQKVVVGLRLPIKYRKRVSKNFWINPEMKSQDKREQIIVKPDCYITPNMFKKIDEYGTYPDLPEIISQEFDGKYFMSMYRYKFIKDNGLDISHEYAQKNNPMSEYVLQLKVPIKELLISACNSYANNRHLVRDDVRTKCSMYRTGEDYFDYHKEEKEDDSEIKKMKGKGKIQPYEDTIKENELNKYLYIIQPVSTIKELQKARDLCDELIAKNGSFLFITDTDNERFINPQLKKYEDSDKWCSFDNFQHYWMQDYDRVIYYYNYEI